MAHAILSPSGASRWMACTPSARFEQQFPESESVYADEGTLAHKIGELFIEEKVGRIKGKAFKAKLEELKQHPLFQEVMLDYCEEYATYVMELYNEAVTRTKDALLLTEQSLDLSDYIPEGFGTSDAIVIDDEWLNITDLKYGKGVSVNVFQNKQQMIYALGAVLKLEFLYGIKMVRMHIYQPRIANITKWELSVSDLKAWAEDELRAKAALAFEGKGEYVPGDHCQFCRGKVRCKALAEVNLEIAKMEFQDPNFLSDEDLAQVLTLGDQITRWIDAVEKYALDQAVNHNKRWPGFKLVAGRSNRTYTDQDAIVKTLKAAGFKEIDIYQPRKLVGITEMEKTIKKKTFAELLELPGLVIKPAGKPKLAPLADQRPELNSAAQAATDFAEPIPE